VMPGASGFEVLRAAKSGPPAKDIPIIMISGVDDTEKVVACIETGADDYVLKPFNATLLRTRVRALLDRKQSRDLEREQTEQLKAALLQLEAERQTTEKLLLSILPRKVCEELQLRGSVSPTYFEDVTIVFTDFVSFTSSTEKLTADELVTLLNEYFTAFDTIVDRYGLEKLKTVGDSYIFLSGLPERTPSHPVDALLASIEMLQYVIAAQQSRPNPGWSMRIGIHTGSVIAGVVGTSKFAFDVWGDAVNFASRMVMSGASNKINVSERAFQRLKDFFSCTPRGLVGIKGNRQAEMYFVDDVLPSLLEEKPSDRPAPFRERYSRYFQRELRAFPPRLNADRSSFETSPSQLAELDTRQDRP
jgi:adenylate cyclase